MSNLCDVIGSVLAALLVSLLAWIAPKAKTWLETNTDVATQEMLRRTIRSFVQAADQLYHDGDPSGNLRRQYVQDQLMDIGIEITEAVLSMIEGSVWEVNVETKNSTCVP